LAHSTQNAAGCRQKVLAAALDLFAAHGFDGVSMNAIASRVGISKANVFHHFGSKEGLYVETMQHACMAFVPVLDGLEESDRAHEERLRRFVRDDVRQMFSDPGRARLILREILESGPSRGQELASEVFDQHFSRVVALFRSGQDSGVFREDIPPALAASMAIACNVFLFQSQHVLRHLSGVDFVDDPERYAGLVSRVLVHGLVRDADGSRCHRGNPE